MKIFKLTGNESVMSLNLEHPIHLQGEYKLALTGFYSDNNIANLKQDSKIYFHYPQTNKQIKIFTLTLKRGFWTLEELQSKCRNYLQELLDLKDITGIDPNSLKLTKSGDNVVISSPIAFILDAAVCKLLGFSLAKSLPEVGDFQTANVNHVGSTIPKLRAVDVIEIHCNLVEHSFVNHDTHWHKHDETEILYHFFPNVPHGYKISEMPNEFHYIPLRNITSIREIKVMIKDQDNQLLVNEDVNNILYLSLIKV